MKLFGTFVLGTAVGFVACGALTVKSVLGSERHRKALSRLIADKVIDVLDNEESNTSRISYVDHNKKRVTMNAERGPIYILFKNGVEAETAFDHIKQLMKEYAQVTVADVCDICDLESNYTDNKYGWTHVSDMYIDNSDRRMLLLPKPLPLE